MSKKIAGLQQVLDSVAGKPKPKPESVPAQVDSIPKSSPKAPSRNGKENVSVWLHPDFKRSLRLAQLAKTDKVYIDDLVAEALNDLFSKYNVPTVTHD